MRKLMTMIFVGLLFIARAQKKEFREELELFVLPNHIVMDYAIGDINNDKLEDAILIFKRLGEDTIVNSDNAVFNDKIPRPMLLLLRDQFGSLYEAKRVDHLIKCFSCGGAVTEPLQSLEINNNMIKLVFKSSIENKLFKEALTYKWYSNKQNWLLIQLSESQSIISNQKNEDAYDYTIAKEAFMQEVTIDDDVFFATRSTTYTHKIRIIHEKSFIYKEPNVHLKPTKKYLIKGDIAYPLKETKHFIWILYIHPTTKKITRGFILKKGISVAVRQPYKKTTR